MRFRPFVSAEAMLEATRRQTEETAGSLPQGIPAGGSTGQVLKKSSGSDYAVAWGDESGGGVGVNVGGSVFDWMRLTNSDTATSINTASLTEIPLATSEGPASGFAKSGNGIQCNFDGTVEIVGSVHMLTSTVQRSAVAIEYFIGSSSAGPRFNTSYIRRASGHNESSSTGAPLLVSVSNGDVITMQGIQEAASGTVTMSAAGRSFLQVKRVA